MPSGGSRGTPGDVWSIGAGWVNLLENRIFEAYIVSLRKKNDALLYIQVLSDFLRREGLKFCEVPAAFGGRNRRPPKWPRGRPAVLT